MMAERFGVDVDGDSRLLVRVIDRAKCHSSPPSAVPDINYFDSPSLEDVVGVFNYAIGGLQYYSDVLDSIRNSLLETQIKE